MSQIKLNNVSIKYGQNLALDNISGTFKQGSLTAIAGANGAGKSTLLKAIMGEVTLSQGEIILEGATSFDIGYLPQAAEIDRNFPLTIEDLVSLGLWKNSGAFKKVSDSDRQKIHSALTKVGLQGVEKRLMSELSAGQFQRVLFARLLLQNAPIILLDEPFTAIDEQTTNDLLSLILEWHHEGRTILAVLHDFEQIKHYFPETLLLAQRSLFWGKSETALDTQKKSRFQFGANPSSFNLPTRVRYDAV